MVNGNLLASSSVLARIIIFVRLTARSLICEHANRVNSPEKLMALPARSLVAPPSVSLFILILEFHHKRWQAARSVVVVVAIVVVAVAVAGWISVKIFRSRRRESRSGYLCLLAKSTPTRSCASDGNSWKPDNDEIGPRAPPAGLMDVDIQPAVRRSRREKKKQARERERER